MTGESTTTNFQNLKPQEEYRNTPYASPRLPGTARPGTAPLGTERAGHPQLQHTIMGERIQHPITGE